MVTIPNAPAFYESGVDGAGPAMWFGPNAPDGDAWPFTAAPNGSIYVQKPASGDGNVRHWVKLKNDVRDDDWGMLGGFGVICERVVRADFTDGGSTSGTYTMNQSIPAGAFVLRAVLENVVGFTGNVSATLAIGDGTDDDRYNVASDFNVFADAVAIDGGAPSGTQIHVAAKTPVITVTSNSDFTAVSGGAATVKIFYLK